MSIKENATKLLVTLYKSDDAKGRRAYQGQEISTSIDLNPDEINDAVEYLADRDLIERLNWKGTAPYMFGQIELNSRGRHIYQELQKSDNENKTQKSKTELIAKQPIAAGSPYGFSDLDWEYTQMRILILFYGYA